MVQTKSLQVLTVRRGSAMLSLHGTNVSGTGVQMRSSCETRTFHNVSFHFLVAPICHLIHVLFRTLRKQSPTVRVGQSHINRKSQWDQLLNRWWTHNWVWSMDNSKQVTGKPYKVSTFQTPPPPLPKKTGQNVLVVFGSVTYALTSGNFWFTWDLCLQSLKKLLL